MRASKPPRVIRSDRSGYSRMVIYWGEDGKRHREYFHSPAEARRRAKELRALLEQAGREAIAAVTPERLTLLRLAEDLQARLAPYALSLEEVGKRLLLFLPVLSRYGVSLEEAFRRTSELLALERNSPPVRMVVERLLDARAKEGKSPRTLRDLRSYLGQFCCSFGDRPIACIRRQEIAEYLDKAPSLWVRYNWQRTLSTLFAFAKTRQWLWENPLHGLPVVRPKLPEIRTYSPREAQTLLVVARKKFPEVLPYLALGFFAGLRRAELQRLDWQDIKGKYVRVSAGKAKTASTRLIVIHPTLEAWLSPYRKESGPVAPKPMTLRRRLEALSKAAGVSFLPNGLRHSFATYHIAAYHDSGKTARMLGHANPELTFRHYAALRTKEEAEAFWAILPPESVAGQG